LPGCRRLGVMEHVPCRAAQRAGIADMLRRSQRGAARENASGEHGRSKSKAWFHSSSGVVLFLRLGTCPDSPRGEPMGNYENIETERTATSSGGT
jgi:hypothetical protein